MFTRQGLFHSKGRAAIIATVAAVALSAVAPTTVMAAPAASGARTHQAGDATDFSAARRRHYRRGGGNAAGLAAFGAIVGTIGAIAASQNRRDYYYDRGPGYGYYHGGPGYYGGNPGYYGGGPAYYGNGYYQ